MVDKEFIFETSNHQKIKIFMVLILVLILVIGTSAAVYSTFKESIQKSNSFKAAKSIIKNEIIALTPLGLFYIGFFGGFFFIFAPVELLFLKGLDNGNNPILMVILVLTGVLLSQAVNYFLGSRFSSVMLNFISKRKVYKVRITMNNYGNYAILFFSILPLPIDVLTFALGITRYNLLRLYVFLFLGNATKFTAIALAYYFFLK